MKKAVEIPQNHPRAHSLRIREMIIRNYNLGIVAPQGIIAHGRGEAFDYLLGEKTIKPTYYSIRAAGAILLLSKNPVISINGNSTALCAKELIELTKLIKGKIEVNLFYYSPEREIVIKNALINNGAENVLGVGNNISAIIPNLYSARRKVDINGIYSADVVLVPLEDGDRTEALRKLGKVVIAIDINPFSRTAQQASITVVDNIIRAIPLLIKEIHKLKSKSNTELWQIVKNFDNKKNLSYCIKFIAERLIMISERKEFYP